MDNSRAFYAGVNENEGTTISPIPITPISPIPVLPPTIAELQLKAALRESSKSHIGNLGKPSWQIQSSQT
jgi:hypothetical protein